MLKIMVLTCSDRAHRGEYEDLSGKEIQDELAAFNPSWESERQVIPDDGEVIEKRIGEFSTRFDVVITCGGTGVGPRDLTPEATRRACDRELPGIAEMLRLRSLEETPFAVFSRGTAGVKGQTLVINLPGSLRAARFCTRLLAPLLEHGLRMLKGEGH